MDTSPIALLPEVPTRHCATCQLVRPLTDFPAIPKTQDKRRGTCSVCYSARHSEQHLMRSYGITAADKDALLAKQGGMCGICMSSSPGSSKGWHVDHDHNRGLVRGVLCHRCNTVLGIFEARPELFVAIIRWLATGGRNA